MPTYSKADFENANAAISTLEQDASDAISLANTIKSFNDSSTKNLKGNSWNLVRAALTEYTDVLTIRKEIAKELADTIKSVNNSIIAKLGTYDSLNTDDIEEEKAILSRCQASLVNIKENSSDKNKENINNNTALIYDQINEAKKMIKQLEELQAAVAAARQKLSSLASSNSNYSSKIAGIIGSSIIYSEKI